jgi:hypothetical protein
MCLQISGSGAPPPGSGGLLAQGWVGSLIGLVGLAVGAVALVLYLRSRVGPRLVYQQMATPLIGAQDQALPDEVSISFGGSRVARVSSSRIVIWNSGTATIRGGDIVASDPPRVVCSEGGRVLRVQVLLAERAVTSLAVGVREGAPGEAVCSFDYLDPGDGAVLEILHDGERPRCEVRGTVRGIPRGIRNWGRVPGPSERAGRTAAWIAAGFSVSLAALTVVQPAIAKILGKLGIRAHTLDARTVILMLVGSVAYGSLGAAMLWARRRRFPKRLGACLFR